MVLLQAKVQTGKKEDNRDSFKATAVVGFFTANVGARRLANFFCTFVLEIEYKHQIGFQKGSNVDF